VAFLEGDWVRLESVGVVKASVVGRVSGWRFVKASLPFSKGKEAACLLIFSISGADGDGHECR